MISQKASSFLVLQAYPDSEPFKSSRIRAIRVIQTLSPPSNPDCEHFKLSRLRTLQVIQTPNPSNHPDSEPFK
uniref:Uncharacterized protein n=1 Tax=Ditylenchus dipsaci TaxID=166011 RepID=A0A915D2B4_9BILA